MSELNYSDRNREIDREAIKDAILRMHEHVCRCKQCKGTTNLKQLKKCGFCYTHEKAIVELKERLELVNEM